MTISAIESRLDQMKIGFTTAINGRSVTRWSFDSYEVGTWGKQTIGFFEAVELVR